MRKSKEKVMNLTAHIPSADQGESLGVLQRRIWKVNTKGWKGLNMVNTWSIIGISRNDRVTDVRTRLSLVTVSADLKS